MEIQMVVCCGNISTQFITVNSSLQICCSVLPDKFCSIILHHMSSQELNVEFEDIDFDQIIPIDLDNDIENYVGINEDDLERLLDDGEDLLVLEHIPPVCFVDNDDSVLVTDITQRSPTKTPSRQSPRKKPSTRCENCNKIFKTVKFFKRHVNVCASTKERSVKSKGQSLSFLFFAYLVIYIDSQI